MKDILAELMGEWCTGVNIGGIILKICLAIVLSAVIGSERATKRHAAGLRTFMLVSLVSALAATVDKFLITEYGVSIPVVTGATVIGLAIVSSNTILYSSKSQIKGLTTSVALWGNSILSVLIGSGFISDRVGCLCGVYAVPDGFYAVRIRAETPFGLF